MTGWTLTEITVKGTLITDARSVVVKVIHRDPDEYAPSRNKSGAVHRFYSNPDPRLHPLENAREIQRAIIAAKLEKIFAKPLVGVLDGHRDAVKSIARCNHHLSNLFTGSCDGEVRHWDISHRRCLGSIRAHEGFVQDLAISPDDLRLYSCGDDATIKAWNFNCLAPLPQENDLGDKGNLVPLEEDDTTAFETLILPVNTWKASGPLTSIDHHWSKPMFMTTGETVDVWSSERSTPTISFNWNDSADLVYSGSFNQVESNLLSASGGDNAVSLFDIRTNKRFSKFFLKMRTNRIAWNPRQPFFFTCANDDTNLYTFDMRKLDRAHIIHKDFTNAVLDVAYSPTGKEFVAGSMDKTVRIFSSVEGRSREVYHGKRMQIVLSCCYSPDSRFVFSGSADFCVRIWKNKAWESLGPVTYAESRKTTVYSFQKTPRERRVLAYREALKERHKHIPQVRRILKHRHVPKLVKSTKEKRMTMEAAEKRAEMNRQLNTKPGQLVEIPEKKRPILMVEK